MAWVSTRYLLIKDAHLLTMNADIDWEYPGGNGADYKQVPNSEKVYQIDAFPRVLQAIRAAIGDKLLSIAVPGKKGEPRGSNPPQLLFSD